MICVFCFQGANPKPFCPDNPGEGCSYGLRHDYDSVEPKEKLKPVAKVDKQRCLLCDLHRRNPASATSECKHTYP
jgi:hypothetical protein